MYSDESSAYKNSIAAGDFQWIFVCNGEGTEQLRNRYVKTLMKTVDYLRNLDVVLVAEEDVFSYMQKVGCIYSETVMGEDR